MPFTPLHMGPGLTVKAVLQRRFSLMVFGWSHTLLGATLIAIISIDALHVLCLVTALVGGLGWYAMDRMRRSSNDTR